VYLIAHFRERAEMMRKNDANHGKNRIPNPKFQIPGKSQVAKLKSENLARNSLVGILSFGI
jgi:hypothetical protein